MKKVLSLVLTLALVLSSFSMAFADDAATATAEPTPAGKAGMTLSDVAKSPNKEAIGVVNDLGIVIGTPEGTFLPEKDVTRAEFAAMITRALAIPKSALEGYQQTPFKDMAGYEWANGYIAFCVSKGIMVGDGMGNAMPGRTVTLNEAVTMALRAVGYVDNSSELKGAWPANFVTKAQELGLYERVAKDSVVANRETAAQLIYNLLPVQKVAVDTDGKTNFIFENGSSGDPVNLLTAGLNAKAVDASVVSTTDLEDSSINMAKYLGQYGKKYQTNRSKDKKTLAFMPDRDYQTLVGRITEGGKKFVTTDGEVTYDFEDGNLDATAYLINGEKQTNALAPSDTALRGKELTLFAKVSGKTIKKHNTAAGKEAALIINKWEVSADKQLVESDLSEVKNARLLGKKFAKDGDAIDTKHFQLMGVATLEDIKVDNVVYVYVADKKIVRVDVGTETAEGTVQRFKAGSASDGTAAVFKIGDKEYKNAGTVTDTSADKSALGVVNFAGKDADTTSITPEYVTDDVKVVLDARGFVYDVTKSNKADKYALVIKEDAAGLDHRAKILLADGTEKVVDVKLSGNANLGDVRANDSGLVAYGLNKDGKITDKDDTITVKSFARNGIEFKSNYVAIGNKYYNIKKDAAVFMYKEDAIGETKTEYSLTSMDKVNKEKNKSEVRILFKNDNIYALLVSGDDAKSGDSKYAVINKAERINSNGDKVLEVKGFIDGVEFKKNTDAHYTNLFGHSATYADANSEVQLFDITVSKDDVITGAKLVNTNENANIGGDLINSDKEHNTRFAQVAKTNDRKAIKLDNNKYLAIADNAIFYKLNSDAEYEVTTAAPRKGDFVKAYELNKEVGYDVVFVVAKDDPDKVSVQGMNVTAGDGELTITKAGRYIMKSEGQVYAVKASGSNAEIEVKNSASQAEQAATQVNANAKITGLENGKNYHLVEIKEATVAVGSNKEIEAKNGAKTFTKDKQVIEVTLTGAKVKTDDANIADNKILATGTYATVTGHHVTVTIVGKANKITMTGGNDGTDVDATFSEEFDVKVNVDQLDAVDYDGGDVYYVLPASTVDAADKIIVKAVD